MAIPDSLPAQRLRRWLNAVRRRALLWTAAATLAGAGAAGLLLSALVLARPAWFLPGAQTLAWVVGAMVTVLAVGAQWFVVRRIGRGRRLIERLAGAEAIDPGLHSALHLAHSGAVSGSVEAATLAIEEVLLPPAQAVVLGPCVRLPRRVVLGSALVASLAALYAVPAWNARGADVLAGLSAAPPPPGARFLARRADLDIRLEFPAYLGRASETLPGSDGALLVPVGTRVHLSASWGEAAERAAILVGGLRVPMTRQPAATFSASFVAKDSGTYRFAVTVDDEELVEERGHALDIIADQPPVATLLFPEKPIELQAPAVVEFLVEGEDDHGIVAAEVRYRIEGAEEEETQVLVLDRPGRTLRQKGELDVAALGLRPGDTLHWTVALLDANPVTGPGIGQTRWQRIHLFDPRRAEEGLIAKVEAFVERLVDRLALLLVRSEAVEAWRDGTEKVLAGAPPLLAALADPRLELAGLAEALSRVVVRVGRHARGYGMGTVSAPTMEDRLERDVLYLDDLLSKKRLAELVELQRSLANERRALTRLMEKQRAAGDDPALKRQIIASIQALRRRLEAISRKMAKLHKRVGEQYMNADAMKDSGVGDQLDQLEAMVRAGNIDEALEALDSMARAMQKLDNQVDQAGQKFGGKEWRELRQKAQAAERLMEVIRQRQERLRGGVQALRKKAQKRHVEAAGGLAKMRKKLQRLIAEARGHLGQIDGNFQSLRERLATIDSLLGEVDNALAGDAFDKALETLDLAEGDVRGLAWSFSDQPAAERQRTLAGDKLGEARRVLETLRPKAGGGLNRREQAALKRAAGEQGEVGEQLAALDKQLKALRQMAPVLGDEALAEAQAAGRASGRAKEAMGRGHPRPSAGAQRDVLDALDSLKKAMQQAGGKGGGKGMPMPFGKPGGGSKKKGKGGKKSAGQRVKIPSGADGDVPGAWREEILEAWGEGFSGPSRGAVDRYYRDLVR